MSDNQIARLDEDNVKTEPAVKETISQSEQQLQSTDVGPSLQDEASAATSFAEHQQPEISEPSRTSIKKRKQPKRFGEAIPTICLKKEGGCGGFKETSKNLDVFFNKVSKNERRTYLTNFTAVSISNGYKTKLNSNFILALSLSYWPINLMSEVNSPTNRNLILTSTDLQLMNLIVPKPYMILMKCWWKQKITSGIRS